MTLTGVPLILLAALGAAGAGTVTIRFWAPLRVGGRLAGVLLLEALTVLTVGLIVNRQEQFYPSWQALRGDTGTATVLTHIHAGALDGHLPPGPFPWRPAALSGWRLAGPPIVTLPAGYRARAGVAFPVVLAFGKAPGRAADAITVSLVPTTRTTAAALRGLPGALRHDLRATATGWDVVGGGALGQSFVSSGIADRLAGPGDLPPALAAPVRLPSS